MILWIFRESETSTLLASYELFEIEVKRIITKLDNIFGSDYDRRFDVFKHTFNSILDLALLLKT